MGETSWVTTRRLDERIDAWYYRPAFAVVDECIENLNSRGITCIELGRIASVDYGFMPMEDYWASDRGVPFLRTTNFGEDFGQDLAEIKYVNPKTSKPSKYRLRNGDVLVIQCGNYTGKVTYIDSDLEGWVYPSFSLRIRCNKEWDPGYLAVILASHFGELQLQRTISVASVRPNTTKPAVEGIRVPNINHDVQAAIGKKLRLTQSLRARMRETLRDAQRRIDGLFSDENPKSDAVTSSHGTFSGWINAEHLCQRIDSEFYRPEYVRNEELLGKNSTTESLRWLCADARSITNGIRGPDLAETDYRMLRLQDVDLLWLDSSRALRVSKTQYEQNRRAWCVAGDLLMAIGGYIGVVGKVVDTSPQTMGQHAARLRFDTSKVDPDYMLAFLCSSRGALLCQRYVSGGIQAGINLEDVREILVPIPEADVQRKVAELVRTAERLRNHYRDLLAEVRRDAEEVLQEECDLIEVVRRADECENLYKTLIPQPEG